MNEQVSNFAGLLLVRIIDENKLSQDSEKNELWKLGYHEAIDMVIGEMSILQKEFNLINK